MHRNGKGSRRIILGLALLAGACGGEPPSGSRWTDAPRGRMIDGTADRREIYELDPASAAARHADGVATLVYTPDMVAHDGVVDLPVSSFGTFYDACSSEPYAAQPISGYCTAWLVAPRLVVTAGHCTSFRPAGSALPYSVVFGFRMLDATHARTTVPASDVYPIVAVHSVCDGPDCTVLELDRPVTGHRILPFRRSGAPAEGDPVYLLGHPFALPLKYDGPSSIFRAVDTGKGVVLAMQQLDVARGDSGAPLIGASSDVVEGILSGMSGTNLEDLDLTPEGCRVEHHVVPEDNYFAGAWAASALTPLVPPRCSGDPGGWNACGANGCGICAAALDTAYYDRYLEHHPNCGIDPFCAGAPSACSEACPAPTADDTTHPPRPPLVCGAGQALVVEDRATVVNGAAPADALWVLGGGLTRLGIDARTGAITSAGPVAILARATVDGDVTSASTITQEGGARVTGALHPATQAVLPAPPTLPVFPPADRGSFTVSGGTQTRAPGSYAAATVCGGTLVLEGGDYFFERLAIHSGVTVRAAATTRIFVRDALELRSPIRAASGVAVQPVHLGFAGATLALEAPFDGVLVAPAATVTLGTGAGLTFTGSFYAGILDVQPGSTLVCR